VWAVRILFILLLAVAANVVYWCVLPRCGVEMPPWFVIAFYVLLIVPLFWVLPSMAPRPGGRAKVTADALSKWGRKGMGEYPGVDESRDRLHRAGWSVGETGGAAGWLVQAVGAEDGEDVERPLPGGVTQAVEAGPVQPGPRIALVGEDVLVPQFVPAGGSPVT
jgi:hypothetical protein